MSARPVARTSRLRGALVLAVIALCMATAPGFCEEAETPVTLTIEVTVVGLKKLRRNSHINAFLAPAGVAADLVRRHVDIDYPKSCAVHDSCGSASLVFEALTPGLDYTLMVCHTAHNKRWCTPGDDGHPKEAGITQVITPSATNSSFTFDLETTY